MDEYKKRAIGRTSGEVEYLLVVRVCDFVFLVGCHCE